MIKAIWAVVAAACIGSMLCGCATHISADCRHPNRAVIAWSDDSQARSGVFDPDGRQTSEVEVSVAPFDASHFVAHVTLPGQLRQVCSGLERYKHFTAPIPVQSPGKSDYIMGHNDAIIIYGVGEGEAGPDHPWSPKGINVS